MNNRKWFRPLMIALAIALVAALALGAGASRFVGDVNSDGKISVFDAQLLLEADAGLRQLTEEQQASAGSSTVQSLLEYILGSPADAGDLDGDGVCEIYTAEGLQTVCQDPAGDYILMNDIDLAGADWTPIAGFSGSLDGNGYTISNINISKSAAGCDTTDPVNMGFFGDITSDAVVENLHLRNVTVTADETALYIGLLVGSSSSDLTNCTVTGTITDARETHTAATCIGVMAGRICTAGNITGGTSVCVCDSQSKYETTGLCADAKLLIASSDNVTTGGLVGSAPAASTVSGIWCDSSCSSTLLSEDIQARQDEVVRYMNKMATIAWTPSQDLTYTHQSNNITNQSYSAGVTYYGLPYNHKNGSLERFQSMLNADGTTVDGLTDGYYTTDENGDSGYVGFVQVMGNDCSSAVGWAWMRISPVLQETGGVYVRYAKNMIPNDTNRTKYGIYPVGSWTSSAYDSSDAAYKISSEEDTDAVLAANSENVILEAYAQTHKGDALVTTSHARLAVTDPVVIRNADGSIDDARSYFLITEQGADFTNTDGDNCTWYVNRKHTFKALLDVEEDSGAVGSRGTYIPVTIRALRDETVSAPYVRANNNSLVSPISGQIYSNYRINSTTVTVTDANGKVYYDQETFTGISIDIEVSRSKFSYLDLSTYSEAFHAAAEESGMKDGQTYYFTLEVLLSDGSVTTVVTDQSFTYTAE